MSSSGSAQGAICIYIYCLYIFTDYMTRRDHLDVIALSPISFRLRDCRAPALDIAPALY